MSDTQRGNGWWLADDGKWYPPELAAPPHGAPVIDLPTPIHQLFAKPAPAPTPEPVVLPPSTTVAATPQPVPPKPAPQTPAPVMRLMSAKDREGWVQDPSGGWHQKVAEPKKPIGALKGILALIGLAQVVYAFLYFAGAL